MNTTVKYRHILSCQNCLLCKTRRSVVLGRGTTPARILIIGETPGRSEDVLGTPFMGESGRLLDFMLKKVGVDPKECFFTNTILCHPTDRKGGETRPPATNEVAACMENVLFLVDQCSAELTILAGDLPKKYFSKLIPTAVKISHPTLLLKSGGAKSPFYIRNLNILEEAAGKING
jgi:DNA polymerase